MEFVGVIEEGIADLPVGDDVGGVEVLGWATCKSKGTEILTYECPYVEAGDLMLVIFDLKERERENDNEVA